MLYMHRGSVRSLASQNQKPLTRWLPGYALPFNDFIIYGQMRHIPSARLTYLIEFIDYVITAYLLCRDLG
jgi:hypothetical protein